MRLKQVPNPDAQMGERVLVVLGDTPVYAAQGREKMERLFLGRVVEVVPETLLDVVRRLRDGVVAVVVCGGGGEGGNMEGVRMVLGRMLPEVQVLDESEAERYLPAAEETLHVMGA